MRYRTCLSESDGRVSYGWSYEGKGLKKEGTALLFQSLLLNGLFCFAHSSSMQTLIPSNVQE